MSTDIDHSAEWTVKAILAVGLLLLAIASMGCAHCPPVKPCPPPEVVRIEVPVAHPWPQPGEIKEYVCILPQFDPKTADLDSLLKVMASDYVRLAKENRDLATRLKAYATTPP